MNFVSFEIALKLKNLGFKEPFVFYWRTDDKLLHHAAVGKPLIYGDIIDDEVIIAPTIEQVFKWLRKDKNMHIEIFLYGGTYSYLVKSITQICKEDLFHEYLNEDADEDYNEYDTYEEAAIAGIEYVLDNLI